MGDHTESIQIDFDPAVLPYERLLDLFWSLHSPCSRSYGTQYRNALFTHGEAQEKAALASKAARAEAMGGRIHTAVEPMPEFWPAEDYHQKYYLRGEQALAAEAIALHPDARAFMNSTAAMRLNAWIAGEGSRAQIERDLPRLGLSESTVESLKRRLLR